MKPKHLLLGLVGILLLGYLLSQGMQPRVSGLNENSMAGGIVTLPQSAVYNSSDNAMEDGDNARNEIMPSPEPPYDGNGSVATDVPQKDRLIVKNGSMSIVVDSVSDGVEQIKQFAVEHNGFVVTSNIESYGSRPSGDVHIRIPSDVFDTGLDALRNLGTVESERVDGRDVTEEYVDVEAQLKNYKATEAQFLSILKDATAIQDVLAVQRELMNVRSNIERLEGRMQYLKESAAFSSLTIYLSTDRRELPIFEQGDEWKPLATIKDALRDLLSLGIDILDGLIWLLIFTPVWIVLVIVIYVARRIYKRRVQ